jgi:hypothetical protein
MDKSIPWVSTPLKNIRQLGLLSPIYGKLEKDPNHQPDTFTGAQDKNPRVPCKYSL